MAKSVTPARLPGAGTNSETQRHKQKVQKKVTFENMVFNRKIYLGADNTSQTLIDFEWYNPQLHHVLQE